MRNIIKNKKKLVISIALCIAMITIGFSGVIAKSPNEKAKPDADWDYWSYPDVVFLNISEDVGIGTITPSEKLDVDGNIAVSGTVDDRNVYDDGLKIDEMYDFWGDHSLAGYLTSYTETDPAFASSDASGITSSDISNWNTAYTTYDTTDDAWTGTSDIYTTSGNVGIGTMTPETRLHVITDEGSAIYAEHTAEWGTGASVITASGDGYHGISGWSDSGYGVIGVSISSWGIVAISNSGKAGNFGGDVLVQGYLNATENVRADDYIYSSPKTHYLSIPAQSFNRMWVYDVTDYQINWHGYGYLILGSHIQLSSPVYLPNNATVTEFRVYYYDGDTIYDYTDIDAHLSFRDFDDPTGANMASIEDISTSGSDTSTVYNQTDDTIAGAKINNQERQYLIYVSLIQDHPSPDLRFYGCRIEYTVDMVNP
jgi:hypothetical protein